MSISSPTLPIASHMNPHRRFSTDSQHAAGKHASLPEGVPFFTPKSSRNRAKKGNPPQTYVFYFPFLPPISVAAMSTSPHEINLCPMLPHHFLFRAKSLPGPTLRAPPKPEAGFRPLPSQVKHA